MVLLESNMWNCSFSYLTLLLVDLYLTFDIQVYKKTGQN